ncbi:MAG: TolC family protein [Planctomycetes bacterium]|jgi:NodT family efflux transporter outer membrane factor (OMF) lipoprotein|nr:TolC family protein [Planctomycetota bacterium]
MTTALPVTRRISTAAFVLAGLACAVATTPPEPFDSPLAFSSSGRELPPAEWWTVFGDPGLDRAVAAALRDSPDLRIAWDRLSQAEAVARREGAALLPDVAARASAARTRESRSGDSDSVSSFGLGLAASYEVDLWGRLRSARDAALFSAAASGADLEAGAISLAGSVATVWFELAEARDQVRILGDQIETNRRVLDLITERFRHGKIPVADVLRQKQLVLSTEGLRTLAGQRTATLAHQLAVLLGRPPTADLGLPAPVLATVPPLPATGLPAELLDRRPDVRGAWLEALAADRRLAEASADRLPRISMSAGVDTAAPEVGDLFDDWLANLAGNLLHPLFDAGWREAEEDRNRAAVSEAVNRYGLTVLSAFREVEDALVSEASQAAYLANLGDQLETSRAVVERIRDSYVNGQVDYLRVLEALTNLQSLERTELAARRLRIVYRVQLYRALAGPPPLPPPAGPPGPGGDAAGSRDDPAPSRARG